jgi:hypothetical protein
MKFRHIITFCTCIFLNVPLINAQSFDDEKVAMTNFVKRMYQATPFEGGKLLEGEEASYHIVAVSSVSNLPKENEKIAQDIASTAFAEPFIKFEFIAQVENPSSGRKLLYYCQPLSKFIQKNYQKQPFDGAKIIASPGKNFFISVVSLDPSKYTNQSLMDRVALIKSKQQANALFNGSTIQSDIIILTEQSQSGTKINSQEIIKEQTMGFVQGLENLLKFDFNEKKIFVYYRVLDSKQ